MTHWSTGPRCLCSWKYQLYLQNWRPKLPLFQSHNEVYRLLLGFGFFFRSHKYHCCNSAIISLPSSFTSVVVQIDSMHRWRFVPVISRCYYCTVCKHVEDQAWTSCGSGVPLYGGHDNIYMHFSHFVSHFKRNCYTLRFWVHDFNNI